MNSSLTGENIYDSLSIKNHLEKVKKSWISKTYNTFLFFKEQ